jgi:septum formation protein
MKKEKDCLYLGSQSQSRQQLLKEACIPFVLVEHGSDEGVSSDGLSFDDYVCAIARDKMKHLILPSPQNIKRDYLYILTADTLVRTINTNKILGKPKDKEDARAMIRLVSTGPVDVVTGCCVRKYTLDENREWVQKHQALWTTRATAEFYVPDEEIDMLISCVPGALKASGACVIEGFGQRYFKRMDGSYTTIIGLPLFEICEILRSWGFVFN